MKVDRRSSTVQCWSSALLVSNSTTFQVELNSLITDWNVWLVCRIRWWFINLDLTNCFIDHFGVQADGHSLRDTRKTNEWEEIRTGHGRFAKLWMHCCHSAVLTGWKKGTATSHRQLLTLVEQENFGRTLLEQRRQVVLVVKWLRFAFRFSLQPSSSCLFTITYVCFYFFFLAGRFISISPVAAIGQFCRSVSGESDDLNLLSRAVATFSLPSGCTLRLRSLISSVSI